MNKEEQTKFLEGFKEGEFVQLTIMVKLDSLNALIEGLKSLNMDLVVIPHVQDELDFQSDEGTGQA